MRRSISRRSLAISALGLGGQGLWLVLEGLDPFADGEVLLGHCAVGSAGVDEGHGQRLVPKERGQGFKAHCALVTRRAPWGMTAAATASAVTKFEPSSHVDSRITGTSRMPREADFRRKSFERSRCKTDAHRLGEPVGPRYFTAVVIGSTAAHHGRDP